MCSPVFFLGRKKHCSKERKVEKHLKRAEALTCTVVYMGVLPINYRGRYKMYANILSLCCRLINPRFPGWNVLCVVQIFQIISFLWIPIINMPENCPAWLNPRQYETHFICLLCFDFFRVCMAILNAYQGILSKIWIKDNVLSNKDCIFVEIFRWMVFSKLFLCRLSSICK